MNRTLNFLKLKSIIIHNGRLNLNNLRNFCAYVPEQPLDWKKITNPTKVPQTPHISEAHRRYKESKRPKFEIDQETLQLLERLSLVAIDSKEGLKILEEAIDFASVILEVDTDNVEPLYTVLENYELRLREDEITDGNIREDVLRNAKVLEEEYFVAPPGNIPLEQQSIKK